MERTDSIKREITVAGPIDRVWSALTEAAHLSQWFGDSAEIDLRPGGKLRLGWSEHGATADGVVEVVDYPNTFAYRWSPTSTDTTWTTTVTFRLEERAGQTVVTVTESGFSRLPDELSSQTLEDNSSGWTAEMADLQDYLERTA